MQILKNTSLVIFGIGVFFLAIGSISFRVRAVANKKAWGGITLPFILIGIVLIIIGIVTLIPSVMNT
ncbi:MAG: hypothetical protein LBD41_07575 [Clostridiales Family XIII bacterium]|nr:hypothetical protein [Clostridiales Family XIII bacterium]